MSSVAVLCVPGRAGARALNAARELAELEHESITLVGEVPQAAAGARCGCSPRAFNQAVAEQIIGELQQARRQLEELGQRVEVRLLLDDTFREFVVAHRFDHALLPRGFGRRIKDLGRAAAAA